MAKRIIIEVDERVLRCGQVAYSGGAVHLANLFDIALPEGQSWSEQIPGIKSGLAAAGLGRGEVDFVVNRRSVEMREIEVPPVPDDELPELLRFTAKNEFASVNDQWKLDYVPISGSPEESRQVLASALAPQAFADLEELAKACQLKIHRILLRPYCIGQAVTKYIEPNQTSLIVQRIGNTLDMVLISNELLRSNRSVLLGGHTDDALQQEIRGELTRTLLATNRLLSGRKLDRVVLLGTDAEWQPILNGFDDAVPLEITDPESTFSKHLTIKGLHNPDLLKEMTAVIGAATSGVSRVMAEVDFANPRRRIVKEFNYRKAVLWGSVAAASLLIIGFLGWSMLASADRQIDSLTKELVELKKMTEPQGDQPGVEQIVGEVATIDSWDAGNVDWLREFSEVSSRLLTADEVILSSIRGRIDGEDTLVTIAGSVDSKEANTDMKTLLSDRPYRVEPQKFRTDDKNPDYRFAFENLLVHSQNVAQRKQLIQDLARERDAAAAGATTPVQASGSDTPSANVGETKAANEVDSGTDDSASDEATGDTVDPGSTEPS